MRTVSLVGSTGSIGTQAIEVIRSEPDRYRVVALGASTSVERLAEQAVALRPDRVAIADASKVRDLAARVPPGTEVLAGPEALAEIARHGDVVVNGVVGFAGLPVTIAALASGRRLALANKESLIVAAPLVAEVRGTDGAQLLPVDSEHCAVHQCLRAAASAEVRRVVLTASGGPFRGRRREELAEVTIDDALAHPTWRMGPKITVDSSTLMNKGLEVIEAHELFGTPYDRIEVVVHPQSIVHSMVETSDGATIAQLSLPDMRLPIGYALAYPERLGTAFGAIDWATLGRLDFEPPDLVAFPCLSLAYLAGRAGGTAPATLNGANEVAVAAFLNGSIRWTDISEVIDQTLSDLPVIDPDTVEAVMEADAEARRRAGRLIEQRAGVR